MGNTLDATHKFACGHADGAQLRRTLLCDRLSSPTAEMVEALQFLQSHRTRLQQIAERSPDAPAPTIGTTGRLPLTLMATGYCILFGYQTRSAQPEDYIAAFAGVLRQPQDFLEDLLHLRAQEVTVEKVSQLRTLTTNSELDPNVFSGPQGEAFRHLAIFLIAAVECAEIYREIRDMATAGQFDAQQAEQLLNGAESDQRSMMLAMGEVEVQQENGFH